MAKKQKIKDKMYDAIFVGSGPACTFAAIELARNNYTNILILEQGVLRDDSKDVSLTSGFLGSGAFSDGKINYNHAVGTTTLPDIVGLKEYYEYLDRQEQMWLDYAPTQEQINTRLASNPNADTNISRFVPTEDARKIRAKALAHNIELSTYPVRHLGSDNAYHITLNIYDYLVSKGVDIRFNQLVTAVQKDGDIFTVTTEFDENDFHPNYYQSKNVMIGVGRSGSASFLNFMKQLGVPVSHGVVDLGVRVEAPDEIFAKIVDAGIYEPKFRYRSRTTDDSCRTFCFDKETKVYTKDGFKLFEELKNNDLFLSVDPKSQEIEWVKAVSFQKYQFSGMMKRIKSKQIDWLVTPEHKMYVKSVTTNKQRKSDIVFKFKNIEELVASDCITAEGSWQGNNPEHFELENFKIDFKNFCEFMGYYLSEGTAYKDHNIYKANIYQTKLDNVTKIEQCLLNCGIEFKNYKSTCNQIVLKNYKLNEYLFKFGKSFEKYIPEVIKNATPENIQIFLDAYCLGDGHIRKIKHGFNQNETYHNDITFYTSSEKIAEDICELILKTGKRPYIYRNKTKGKTFKHHNGDYVTNHDIYHVSPRVKRNHQFHTIKITEEFYNDYVYDVTLEKNHTLLILRNNKIWWGSNCHNPSGFVVAEEYPHTGLVTANGHSLEHTRSTNTNFAILVSKIFTAPFNDPTAYVEAVCKLANLLSGGGLLVQRFGDLKEGRRSTEKRIAEGNMIPTCEATPGDLSLVIPYRQLLSIIEMLEAMNGVLPGIASKYTLLYGIEAKFYSNNVEINATAQTKVPGVYVGGDGSGHSRGLNASCVMGLMVAKGLLDAV